MLTFNKYWRTVLQEDYTNNEFKNSGKGTNIATTISKFVKVKI